MTLSIKTVVTFSEDDFDRLLELTHPSGLRIIAPENGVGRAKTISLHMTPGSAWIHMLYYPINTDGSVARSARVWHEELPPHPDYVALMAGPDETAAIEAGMATLGTWRVSHEH